MNFGQAIEALKQAKAVARKGWNGKGMRLALEVPHSGHNYIAIKCVDGFWVPWTASQLDMLADDWFIVPSSARGGS